MTVIWDGTPNRPLGRMLFAPEHQPVVAPRLRAATRPRSPRETVIAQAPVCALLESSSGEVNVEEGKHRSCCRRR